jgi:hypothetical protein
MPHCDAPVTQTGHHHLFQTNEPIGIIILITSWLTINIAPFTLGQMNIITSLNLSHYNI